MRKLLLVITLVASVFGAKAQDQLYNKGFNMWGTDFIARYPTTWVNSFDAFGALDTSVISRSTDATDQDYSIKLKTTEGGGDPIFGFILHGSIGNQGPEGGVPFTLAADSIIIDAKYDIQAGDSANIIVLLKNSGIPFEMKIIPIGGSQPDWTRLAFKINQFGLTPDSLILGFTSSAIDGSPAIGSWIMIDNIRFAEGSTISSPIDNPSFEDWTDIMMENVNEFTTFNNIYATQVGAATALKSTDAQEGTFALNLTPDSLTMNGGTNFVPGIAVYGDVNWMDFSMTGKPFTASPTALTGFFKYTPANGDQGSISVTLTSAGNIVGQGMYTFDTQNSYTAFNIPLTVTGTPDSVLVVIDGGQIGGSSLLIDNLQFTGGDVGVKQIGLTDATIGVYPNPTTSDATLKVGLPKAAVVSYTVFNALGQTMDSDNLGSMKDGVHTIKLNTGDYSTGVYFVKVKIGENTMTQKVIVK